MTSPITPRLLDKEVLSFCSSITSSTPFYVDVRVEPYSNSLFCFPNVQEKIKRDGGDCLFGWQIWILPGIFIEAEFHGIWESPEDEYVDITPKQNNENKILFLPDPKKEYKGRQVNNIRHPLSNNSLISHYFITFDALFALNNFGERANQYEISFRGEEAEIYKWLIEWQLSLQKMIMEGHSKNSICPCGRGKKYKLCCGKTFEQGIAELKCRYKF